MKNHFVQSLLVAFGLFVANISYAASPDCSPLTQCNQPNHTSNKTNALQNVAKTTTTPHQLPVDSVADLAESLALSQAQNLALYRVIKQQMPEVTQSIQNLQDAQAMLRNMAVNQQYDETIANMLAQTIANNSANLALLQAQREYEILAMLTPEQIEKYTQLIGIQVH
jgi:Spy/CpxP family protein refolding chaperone